MTEATAPAESLAGLLRLAATLAGLYVEHIARRTEQAAKLEAAARTEEATQLRARLAAERDAARALVAPTSVPGWWTTATPEQVARVWEVATAWAPSDARLAAQAAVIETEIRTRYGVDPARLLAEARAAAQPAPAQAERGERAEAAGVLAADTAAGRAEQAGRDRAAGKQPRPVLGEDFPGFGDRATDTGAVDLLAAWDGAWDSPAARADRAARATRAAGPDTEAATAVVTADQSQGTPPSAAVRAPAPAPKRAPRRAGPGKGAEPQTGR